MRVILDTAPAELMAKQWLATYEIGHRLSPPTAIAASACFGFLASQSTRTMSFSRLLSLLTESLATWQNGLVSGSAWDPTSTGGLYAIAAVLLPSIVPWTLAMMLPTNNKLMEAAAKPGMFNAKDTRQLVLDWKRFNLMRTLIFGAGGATLAAIATIRS